MGSGEVDEEAEEVPVDSVVVSDEPVEVSSGRKKKKTKKQKKIEVKTVEPTEEQLETL